MALCWARFSHRSLELKAASVIEFRVLYASPQRQAAKKASENMRSIYCCPKRDEQNSVTDKQTSGDDTKAKTPVKSSSKPPGKGKEMKEGHGKISRKKSKELEKEPIAYVPQRQAAKKAAAHIKSGLGTKLPATEMDEKKKDDQIDPIKSSAHEEG
ncbi:unnamed protein product [Arctia plantaginis]|uniref:Uncharacterized protein n=1 Tax=Arctia plantaginis TaxID=874455 RepID=A0A8S1B6C3_ARCPL|nr:unnamed protein product [Arctia plantaginis]